MRNTKIQSRNKHASIAAFDCLFSIVIILMVLIPVLNQSYYSILSSQQTSKNTQKLSGLLQISEYYYTIKAAKISTAPFSPNSYSHSGVLSSSFNPNQIPADYRSMGLTDFSISLTTPKILSTEQFCIKRVMLGTNSQPADIWFCAS